MRVYIRDLEMSKCFILVMVYVWVEIGGRCLGRMRKDVEFYVKVFGFYFVNKEETLKFFVKRKLYNLVFV